MTTWKLAPALAAGCAVVLKPDPQTPLTALRLAELAAEVGFPAGRDQRRPRRRARRPARTSSSTPASTRSRSPARPKTGGEIMRLASDPIKRVTLELGGKSPNLVFADADLADAIPSSVWSIYYAAGQSCEARSRVLVEQLALRRLRRAVRRQGRRDQGRRPARPRDADGLADLAGAPRPGARLRRARAARRAPRSSPAASRRRARARSTRRPCRAASTTR